MTQPQIVWLRRDLRMADQPALYAAASAGPVVPVYVLDDARAGDHAYGGASRWWLHHSLESMGKSCANANSRIVLRQGDAPQILASLAEQVGAECIHAIRHYEPWWKEAEDELRDALNGDAELRLYDGKPEDMAGAALFLASPLSSYIYGQTLIVDGGLILS